MKKEIGAALLLCALLIGSLLNLKTLDTMTDELNESLMRSLDCVAAGDFAAAERELEKTERRWNEARPYTEIFVRHPEIDAVDDALCELKGLLAERNAEGCPSAFDKVSSHLRCIDEMEHVRFGSVL
ncbi:MAG: DUF4363 family protein [Oscillospiraceae bacterium]|nr:DUF4363 family protein [Oscillospiraceae bacterium]